MFLGSDTRRAQGLWLPWDLIPSAFIKLQYTIDALFIKVGPVYDDIPRIPPWTIHSGCQRR
jgi:hypothetical protein